MLPSGLPANPASKRSAPAKRAAAPERLPWMEQQLITSNFDGQTAEEVCNSETSWGPDFIGVDGKFCDMGAKTLHSLCDVENVEGCVVTAKNGTFQAQEAGTILKTYDVLSTWG